MNIITYPRPDYSHLATSPDSKVHGANMGPTWVLSAPDGPHVGPMNLAVRVSLPQVSSNQSGHGSIQTCNDDVSAVSGPAGGNENNLVHRD